jgi:hypothetical protein
MTTQKPAYASDGAALIAAERQRQIDAEGWTPEHDAEHVRGELADAALLYLARVQYAQHGTRMYDLRTPARNWIKEADDLRMLVKAGALIAAEIDRRTAAKPRSAAGE